MISAKINLQSLAFAASISVCGFIIPKEVSAQETDALLDRAAIYDVLTQYSYRWDSKDSVGFAELFTDDGSLERQVNGEKIDSATVKGKDAILNYAKNSHQGRLADRLSRHHFSGIVFIELNETTAITENMALITHQTENSAPFIVSSGYYLNSWTKTENGWRISKRVLKTDTFEN